MENVKDGATKKSPLIVRSIRLLNYMSDCNLLKYLFKVDMDKKYPTKRIYLFEPVQSVADAIEYFRDCVRQEREEREGKFEPVIEIENNAMD